MIILYVFWAFSLFGGTLAVVSMPDHCTNFPSQAGFNLDAFLRRWYVLKIYFPNTIDIQNISCAYVEFSRNKTANDVKVNQYQLFTGPDNGPFDPSAIGNTDNIRYETILNETVTRNDLTIKQFKLLNAPENGPFDPSAIGDTDNIRYKTILNETVTSTFHSDTEPGIIEVVTKNNKKFYEQIIATDYDYYAIIYSCADTDLNNPLWREQIVTVYSSQPILTEAIENTVDEILESYTPKGREGMGSKIWNSKKLLVSPCMEYFNPIAPSYVK